MNRGAGRRLTEDKSAEDKSAEDKSAEDKSAEDKSAEDKSAEEALSAWSARRRLCACWARH